jgi:STE24 endopeptidase
MPVSLLIALVLAFGLNLNTDPFPLRPGEAPSRLAGMVVLVVGFAVVSRLSAWRISRAIVRDHLPARSVRRQLQRRARVLDAASLLLFGLFLYAFSWRQVVEEGLGLSGLVLVDETVLLSPFLVLQLGLWWGLYPAEKALRVNGLPDRVVPRLGPYLVVRARQSLGMVLPAALLYVLTYDLAGSPTWQFVGLAGLGTALIVLAPALVRLSWPTRRLPDSPLRARLESLAQRLGFRFTDILVWDTDYSVVNAGVTGALPRFRYVLLTDSLIETLDPDEVEAVFGHEIGHVAHRHLAYFGFFFVGSMGVMALVAQGLSWLVNQVSFRADWLPPIAVEVTASIGWLSFFLLYLFSIFGFISRRFERQADIYGCRAVSCGREDCPPHVDLNRGCACVSPGAPSNVCPVGIRIFARALQNVAMLNGMAPGARSWRHGSIRRRIDFLEGLEGHPEVLWRFQRRVRWLRLGLGLLLLIGIATALATGALEQL